MNSDSGWRSWRPSPALAVSFVALFVALSGSALALSRGEVKSRHIAKNAVKSKQLNGNAVKSKHVKRNAIKSKHVKNGVITEAKLADGVGGLRGPAGSRGAAGPQGPKGDPGDPAAPLRSGRVTLSFGETRSAISAGPFTLNIRCTQETTGAVFLRAFVTSTEAQSRFEVSEGSADDTSFGPGNSTEVSIAQSGTVMRPRTFFADAPSGATLHGTIGVSLDPAGGTCTFNVAAFG